MIEKLRIRNFGPHRKLDVEFSPTVTTIVGSSYTGKSALIRALRLVCRNQPAGNSFISWGAERTSVRLTVDGKKVTRRKGNSNINLYKLNKKEFTAFGNGVPPEITKVLNVSDMNFQKQMTLPFWFVETAGEVSRQLNSIVNLQVIDKTLAEIVSQLNENKSTIRVTKERIETNKEQKEKLAYVKEIDKDCRELESINNRKAKNAVELDLTSEIIKRVRLYRVKRDLSLKLKTSGLFALSAANKSRDLAGEVDLLQKLVKKAKKTRRIIKDRPPSLKPLDKLKSQLKGISIQYQDMSMLIGQAEEWEETIRQRKLDLKKYKLKLDKVGEGKCPLCGKKMIK